MFQNRDIMFQNKGIMNQHPSEKSRIDVDLLYIKISMNFQVLTEARN